VAPLLVRRNDSAAEKESVVGVEKAEAFSPSGTQKGYNGTWMEAQRSL